MLGKTQTINYGATKNGNLYQYEKTNKAKKAGALLGTGAGIARTIEISRQHKNKINKFIKEGKDIYLNENIFSERIQQIIKKVLNNKKARIGMVGGVTVGVVALCLGLNRATFAGIGSIVDSVKNTITKHNAAKEADAQAQQV